MSSSSNYNNYSNNTYSNNKKWTGEEENQLINEVNKLEEMDKICESHQRQPGGIIYRLKKILDNEDLSKKIDQNVRAQILNKYFSNKYFSNTSKEKFIEHSQNIHSSLPIYKSIDEIIKDTSLSEFYVIKILNYLVQKEKNVSNKLKLEKILGSVVYDENNIDKLIIENIFYFKTFDDIIKRFSKTKKSKIMDVLKNYLKLSNPDKKIKEKIKAILKDYRDKKNCDSGSVDDQESTSDNTNDSTYKKKSQDLSLNNDTDDNDQIISNLFKMVLEIKNNMNIIKKDIFDIKADIFDMNKRIKCIYEKNINHEKNINMSNKKKSSNKKNFSNTDQINDLEQTDNLEKTNQSLQLEQLELTEQIEITEQTEQTEQIEQIEQIEKTAILEQINESEKIIKKSKKNKKQKGLIEKIESDKNDETKDNKTIDDLEKELCGLTT